MAKKNTLLFIGLGAAALGLIYWFKSKKQANEEEITDFEPKKKGSIIISDSEKISEEQFNEPVSKGSAIDQAKETLQVASDSVQTISESLQRTPEQIEAAKKRKADRLAKRKARLQQRKAKRKPRKKRRKSSMGDVHFI